MHADRLYDGEMLDIVQRHKPTPGLGSGATREQQLQPRKPKEVAGSEASSSSRNSGEKKHTFTMQTLAFDGPEHKQARRKIPVSWPSIFFFFFFFFFCHLMPLNSMFIFYITRARPGCSAAPRDE